MPVFVNTGPTWRLQLSYFITFIFFYKMRISRISIKISKNRIIRREAGKYVERFSDFSVLIVLPASYI